MSRLGAEIFDELSRALVGIGRGEQSLSIGAILPVEIFKLDRATFRYSF